MKSDNADGDSTLTAKLVTALDQILFTVGGMENNVRHADLNSLTHEDRRALRSGIDRIFGSADRMMTWLSEQRLESPKN